MTVPTQKWKKLGHVFCPDGSLSWMASHATTPTPLHLEGSRYRIYFSSRDRENRNQVGYVEIDLENPLRILACSREPVLALGDLGEFDCDGIYATSLVQVDGELRVYYAGWNAGLRGLFYSSIGVAVSRDRGMTFEKYGNAPILARDALDRWAVMAPFVRKEEDSWRMWYVSGIRLYREGSELKSLYDVKVAVSKDGYAWEKTGITALSLGSRDSNIARACVLKDGDKYRCWYPYVSKELGQYRIGYAESRDGMRFERMDDRIDLPVSDSGWDSLAVTYPHVFRHENRLYMLYNGNEFGKTGFGMAVLESLLD